MLYYSLCGNEIVIPFPSSLPFNIILYVGMKMDLPLKKYNSIAILFLIWK